MNYKFKKAFDSPNWNKCRACKHVHNYCWETKKMLDCCFSLDGCTCEAFDFVPWDNLEYLRYKYETK